MAQTEREQGYLLVRKRLDDLETPVSALLKLDPDRAGTFLFESVVGGESRGRFSFIGLDPDLWWRVRDGVAETSTGRTFAPADIVSTSDRPLEDLRCFRAACQVAAEPGLPPMAAGAFGYLGYEMVRYFERLPPPKLAGPDLAEALLMRPRAVLVFDALRQEVLLCAPVRRYQGETASEARSRVETLLDGIEVRLDRAPPKAPRGTPYEIEFASNMSKPDYLALVETAKKFIRAGDIFQVVPSQRFRGRFELPGSALYRSIRRLNPSPFMFFLNCGDAQVIGASPEILVRTRDNRVTIRPIAGTAPRGADIQSDMENERRLLADPKERAEHMMLLDLGRNDVGRTARAGSVSVTESYVIERYSHVMHIVSNVEGVLQPGLDSLDALMAGFPAGTVSGAPKIRAMEIINDLEPERRGIYGGGIGYFGLDGAMDFCIALRTGVITGGELLVQAGGGVVLDSDPEAEWQETLHKAGALMAAAREAGRYR